MTTTPTPARVAELEAERARAVQVRDEAEAAVRRIESEIAEAREAAKTPESRAEETFVAGDTPSRIEVVGECPGCFSVLDPEARDMAIELLRGALAAQIRFERAALAAKSAAVPAAVPELEAPEQWARRELENCADASWLMQIAGYADGRVVTRGPGAIDLVIQSAADAIRARDAARDAWWQQRLAADVAAAAEKEREECAKVADNWRILNPSSDFSRGRDVAAEGIASRIRARKEKP